MPSWMPEALCHGWSGFRLHFDAVRYPPPFRLSIVLLGHQSELGLGEVS